MDKDRFTNKYKQTILDWAKDNKLRIVEARKNYSWGDKAPKACLDERDLISREIIFSRLHHDGGVSLETLDLIMTSGGFDQFPLRDGDKVLESPEESSILLKRAKFLRLSKSCW